MNWKSGFQRVTLVISVLILLIGAGITASTVSDVYSNYRYYNSPAFEQNPWGDSPSQDTGFDPDAYLAERKSKFGGIPVTDEAEVKPKYEPEILPVILWGALFTILAAAFPWVIFGLGLYLISR